MTYKELFNHAKKASEKAYAPYSNFKVGAALLTDDGKIYSGANIENMSYGATICAERVAMSKAVFDGAKKFVAIAVYSPNKKEITPCGICRQFLGEFCDNLDVIISEDKVLKQKDLLPYGFDI